MPDLNLGIDFLSQHDSVTFKYGGQKPSLSVCGLTTLDIEPPSPFLNLTSNCHPIATKSRCYSKDDLSFISLEVERLLKAGIIEPSHSPCRAQVVVTKDENHKKHLAIDYSQTINRCFPSAQDQWYSQHVRVIPGFQYPGIPECLPSNTFKGRRQALYCFWSGRWTLPVHTTPLWGNQRSSLLLKRDDEVRWRQQSQCSHDPLVLLVLMTLSTSYIIHSVILVLHDCGTSFEPRTYLTL